MRFLLITFGSSGDVNPFVGIGQALKARGHTVRLATNPYFRKLIQDAGLEFIPVGTVEDFEASLNHPDLWHPRRGLQFVIRSGIIPLLRPSYDLVESFHKEGPGVVVASLLALGARVAQEKLGVPLVTVQLQPIAFPSLADTPVYSQTDFSRWPRWVKRIAYWIGDRMTDRMLDPDFNELRVEKGLHPVFGVLMKWANSPLLSLGLWPEWFGPPQPDWPPQVRLTGFPLFDAGAVQSVPEELNAFLRAGPAPVIFTPGSAMRQGRPFFAESVKACRLAGARGVLLTKFPDQIPHPLTDSVRQFGYVPFSQVLPEAAVFVHHGGIGTTSQALAAGIPQIVMPLAHDQPDNAARVKRLGVGEILPPARYTAAKVAALVKKLTTDPGYRTRAAELRQKLHSADPLSATCDAIESSIPFGR
jgi:rhamnosyltransferase subunit B